MKAGSGSPEWLPASGHTRSLGAWASEASVDRKAPQFLERRALQFRRHQPCGNPGYKSADALAGDKSAPCNAHASAGLIRADAVLRYGEEIMSCLGVHFALKEPEVQKLKSLRNDRERLTYVQEELEEHYLESDREHTAETDKAWDAIHRALTDGTLTHRDPRYPYGHVILGGESLYSEDDCIMSLKTPAQVHEVLGVLESMTQEQFRLLYFSIPQENYGHPLTVEDFEYSWSYLTDMLPFWKLASTEGRYVLFTADQ
jgi:hypothetical protein